MLKCSHSRELGIKSKSDFIMMAQEMCHLLWSPPLCPALDTSELLSAVAQITPLEASCFMITCGHLRCTCWGVLALWPWQVVYSSWEQSKTNCCAIQWSGGCSPLFCHSMSVFGASRNRKNTLCVCKRLLARTFEALLLSSSCLLYLEVTKWTAVFIFQNRE